LTVLVIGNSLWGREFGLNFSCRRLDNNRVSVFGIVLWGLLTGHIAIIVIMRIHGTLHVLIIPPFMEIPTYFFILGSPLEHTVELLPFHLMGDEWLHILLGQLLRTLGISLAQAKEVGVVGHGLPHFILVVVILFDEGRTASEVGVLVGVSGGFCLVVVLFVDPLEFLFLLLRNKDRGRVLVQSPLVVVVLREVRLFVHECFLVFEFGVAPFRIKCVLVVSEGGGVFVAARGPLHGLLVLVISVVTSSLEDIGVVAGRLALRVLDEHARAVLGAEDVDVLVALVFGLNFFEAAGKFVHLKSTLNNCTQSHITGKQRTDRKIRIISTESHCSGR
jgi:hypothetical protein